LTIELAIGLSLGEGYSSDVEEFQVWLLGHPYPGSFRIPANYIDDDD
jgi:hypothetical protein